ncbi:MAG: histidine kinase [Gemmatimonadota bacterium]
MKRLRTILLVALAWLPFAALWALFILTYVERASFADAVESAVSEFGVAALLGIGVWWFSGRYAWPAYMRVRFYVVHLAAAAAYSALWNLVGFAIEALSMDTSFWGAIQAADALGWQFLLGFILYGLVAGVSYALRNRRRLREQEALAARAEALAVEARMQALRAQLNPHFLFNCLHSLAHLIRQDPASAETAVERLGGLLRYSLDDAGGVVTLADEWSFTRDYLELERLRFGARLRVESDLQQKALAASVPPFTLQPLVENAVRHAIDPRPEGGVVRITAGVTAGQLNLRVGDDGPGADPGAVEAAPGIGLRALRQRLRARYGGAARVAVLTAPGEGCEVVVRVPLEDGDP